MRAVLHSIHSPDVDDLSSFVPEDHALVEIFAQLMIGPMDSNGYESFDLIICTVDALRRKCQTEGVVVGNHYLFVETWNYAKIKMLINSIVSSIEADDWQGVVRQLNVVGRWEYSS